MNIRQVRKKIKSVFGIKKITKAMELVSAIKMKKAQQKAIEGIPYQEKIEQIINKIVSKINPELSLLLRPGKRINKELVIIISTNKGLCGGFNFNLFRFLVKNHDQSNTEFIVIGKKGGSFVSKMNGKIIADFSSGETFNNVSAIFSLALKYYYEEGYAKVWLVYNKFVSTIRQEPVQSLLLPFQLDKESSVKEPVSEYLIEPSPQKIIEPLLKSFLEEKIRFAIIQNEAGEHSSRMVAMKNATENANDLSYSLTLLRNKLRQEKITYELLDMITAKESAGQ